ncbi:CoA-transferase [Nonomuraea sp. NPDC003804]|uniref:CoA-transferase subunit beta n=1 Tax=Nonomuraea sp. NPDC003804 TaxID=3154547 RepID=UPI0033AB4837
MSRADVCVVACAEAFRGDGEIVAAGIGGPITMLAARLARMTFEPDLITTDGVCLLTGDAPGVVEGWLPVRDHLWLALNGRRHVFLGASQIDRHGNTNISCIGPWERPKAQLLGVRGAPGNTVCCPTSYWIPRHGPRVFVEKVDMISGVGGPMVRRVVTNLAVLDLGAPDGSMRLVSVHPGVSVAEVVAATGFELAVPPDVPTTRLPTDEERRILETLDPGGLRGESL